MSSDGKQKSRKRKRSIFYGMLCLRYRGAHCERETVHLPRTVPEGVKRSILEETESLKMISDALDLGWEPIYAEEAEGEVMWLKKRIYLRGRGK